jgi:hypothetical protein
MMKFGIRDLLLLLTWIATTFWAFSFNKTLGRHFLLLTLSLSTATIFGLVLKGDRVRTRCAIGSFVGTSIYGIVAYFLNDWMFEVNPYISKQTLFPDALPADFICLAAFSVPFFSTLAPFLIVHIEKHELTEEKKIDRTMSGWLLIALGICYLMLVLDGWRMRYLESHWMTVFLLLSGLFVMTTLPWTGKHFESIRIANTQTGEMSTEVVEPPFRERLD